MWRLKNTHIFKEKNLIEREKFQKCSLSVFLTCFTSRQLFTLMKILNPLLNAPDIKTNSWFFREKEIKHLLLTCMPIKYYLCRIYETLSITYLRWTDLHAENWQYFALSVSGFCVLLLVLSILLILTDNLFRVIHSDRKLMSSKLFIRCQSPQQMMRACFA